MKTNFSKKSNPNQEVYDEFSRIMASNRFIFGFMGIFLAILFTLGLYVVIIASGIWLGLILMGRTFDTPYRFLRAILYFGKLPPHLNTVSFWEKVWACVAILVPALFVYIGVKGLQVGEFCVQSPMCALAGFFFH